MAILFSFPGNESLANALADRHKLEKGELTFHRFPDEETLLRVESDVSGKDVIVVCTLDRADEKSMALMFFAETVRELGAASVKLVAPYLGYMRQDKRFHEGEAVTSKIFASFISSHFDSLVTIDPHLHRYRDMAEIYRIPVKVCHAAGLIASWITQNVQKPLVIGPDEESAQWAGDIAAKANAPCTVLTKTRLGDNDVGISIPAIETYKDHIPVLVDDIISTARTMIETISHLKAEKTKPPICIGIHAVFSGDAYKNLKNSGPEKIITCNTIEHLSNGIDVAGILEF